MSFISNFKAVFVMLLVSTLAFSASKNNKKDLFSQGLALYSQERYKEANKLFEKHLQKTPNDMNATVYLAKSYYKMDDIEKSYTFFSRVNRDLIDIETSYEYGQVYFIMKKYPESLAAFKKVPATGHALSDLANYFAGVCSIKLRDYESAEKCFEKAEVLPAKLARRKKVYLEQLQKIFAIKRRQEIASYRKDSLNSGKGSVKKIRKKSQDGSSKKKRRRKRVYKHKGIQDLDKKNEFGISLKNQKSELGGFGSDSSDIRSIYFNFKNNLSKFYGRSYKSRHALGIDLDLSIESRSTEGIEQRNLSSDSASDQFRIQESPFSTGTTNNLALTATIFYDFPLTHSDWLDFNLYYLRVLPEFEGGYGGGDHGASIAYRKTIKSLKLGGSVESSFLRDEDHEVTTTKLSGEAYSSYDFAGDLYVKLAASFDQNNYELVNQSGPDSVATIKAVAEQLFPLEIKVKGEVGTTIVENYTVFPDPTKFIQAESNGFYFSANAEAVLFKWVKVYLKYQKSFEKWSVTSAEAADQDADQDIFDSTVPNIIDTFEYGLSVNVLF